ncbi:MAG: DNA polymerase/3'-5' exonuclease PolX [Saprospiraceae bacterium]|nr:DNA polymerase/3'-5' exonuclease PolX [Saprospiraceae bacterium]
MTNKEIARTFQFLGNIMELHDENKFKIRSYQNAYISLRKLDQPLAEMSDEEIGKIKGVGKAIVGKIRELLDGGQMATLERYKAETPVGIQEMLGIKGFGPKKIKAVWKDLGVQSVGELLYAVNENRLIELNGFGEKTQEDLKQKLEYFQRSQGKSHYAKLEGPAHSLLEQLQTKYPDVPMNLVGAIRRKANEVESIDLLVGKADLSTEQLGDVLEEIQTAENGFVGTTADGHSVRIYVCAPGDFGSKLFRYSASSEFLNAFVESNPGLDFSGLATEDAVFSKAKLPFVEPELREQSWALELAKAQQLPKLVELSDLKGVLHNHSTYSDGLHSLRDMATYTKEQGYEYLGMSDHSKSAFYANGLQVERVYQQMEEIDQLNQELAPFRVFKSIESDILNDGSLDYEEDVLKAFDFIIASVHTNLRMDEVKATQRLITAIENPYTRILGHPTGRLLLSREGYPIDHKKVIDACAENGVAIELNANPYRLDLDWTWIPYALEKGVLVSVNPDAHSKEGIHDMHFGVLSARKGGLTAETCLNAKSLAAFEKWLVNGR